MPYQRRTGAYCPSHSTYLKPSAKVSAFVSRRRSSSLCGNLRPTKPLLATGIPVNPSHPVKRLSLAALQLCQYIYVIYVRCAYRQDPRARGPAAPPCEF